MASEAATTFDLDAGAMVSAWDLRFGLTARNLREPEFQSGGGHGADDRGSSEWVRRSRPERCRQVCTGRFRSHSTPI